MYEQNVQDFTASRLVAQVGAGVHADPSLLWLAPPVAAPPAAIAVQNGQLVITPTEDYAGTLQIMLSVNDGNDLSWVTFEVAVVGSDPVSNDNTESQIAGTTNNEENNEEPLDVIDAVFSSIDEELTLL